MHLVSSINFIYTYSCNCVCRHCCFDCSPNNHEKLSYEKVDGIIQQIKKFPFIKSISFSGGEIFLFLEELEELIRKARLNKLQVVCNTNGFWGENAEHAEKIMKHLKRLGISLLSLSYDRFHAEFIPFDAICNIIRLSKRLGINTNIKGVILRDDKGFFQLIDNVQNSVVEVPIFASCCMKYGRAKQEFTDEQFINEEILNTRCDSLGRELTIYPNGDVTPCRSPASFFNKIILGNINYNSLEEILFALSNNRCINKYMKYGFSTQNFPQELNIQSLCDLCATVLNGYFFK